MHPRGELGASQAPLSVVYCKQRASLDAAGADALPELAVAYGSSGSGEIEAAGAATATRYETRRQAEVAGYLGASWEQDLRPLAQLRLCRRRYGSPRCGPSCRGCW